VELAWVAAPEPWGVKVDLTWLVPRLAREFCAGMESVEVVWVRVLELALRLLVAFWFWGGPVVLRVWGLDEELMGRSLLISVAFIVKGRDAFGKTSVAIFGLIERLLSNSFFMFVLSSPTGSPTVRSAFPKKRLLDIRSVRSSEDGT
jgi:hypothetical protein